MESTKESKMEEDEEDQRGSKQEVPPSAKPTDKEFSIDLLLKKANIASKIAKYKPFLEFMGLDKDNIVNISKEFLEEQEEKYIKRKDKDFNLGADRDLILQGAAYWQGSSQLPNQPASRVKNIRELLQPFSTLYSFEKSVAPTLDNVISIIKSVFDNEKSVQNEFHLKKIVPLETPSIQVPKSTVIAPFYINPPLCPEVFHSFQNTVNAIPRDNKSQGEKVVLLYQLSMVGKTKLCFSLGFQRPMVILRPEHAGVNAPYASILNRVEKQMEVVKTFLTDIFTITTQNNDVIIKLKSAEALTLVEYVETILTVNERLIELWILTHYEFYLQLSANENFNALTSIVQNELYLRACCNGGVGREYINSMYNDLCRKYLFVPHSEYTAFAKDLKSHASGKEITVCYDDLMVANVQDNIWRRLFPHYTAKGAIEKVYRALTDPAEKATSYLYALVSVAQHGAKDHNLAFIFTGTRFKAVRQFLKEHKNETSRQELNYISFETPQLLTVPQMLMFLSNVFPLPETTQFIAEITAKLKLFEGRPGFFFEFLVRTFWARIQQALVQDYGSVLLQATNDALNDLIKWATAKIETFASKRPSVYKILSYFNFMHNGIIDFSEDEKSFDVVDAGLGFLRNYNYVEGKIQAKVFAEVALQKAFTKLVSVNIPDDSSPDPIYQFLCARYPKFKEKDGGFAEQVLCRFVAKHTKPTLYELFDGEKLGIPKDSIIAFLKFDVSVAGKPTELDIEDLNSVISLPASTACFPRNLTKPDLVTSLIWTTSAGVHAELDPPLAFFQSRNFKIHLTPASFQTAIDTLNPNYFWHSRNTPESADRISFLKWWDTTPQHFDRLIRIVFCSAGFNKQVRQSVTAYNTKYGKLQPIILLAASESLFPEPVLRLLQHQENVKTSSSSSTILQLGPITKTVSISTVSPRHPQKRKMDNDLQQEEKKRSKVENISENVAPTLEFNFDDFNHVPEAEEDFNSQDLNTRRLSDSSAQWESGDEVLLQ